MKYAPLIAIVFAFFLIAIYPIYSEENTPKFKKDHSYWLIDPIDGTSSWYHGYPGFVTQLSLIIKNEPSFGLIYWPHKNLSWYCDRSGVFFQL